MEAHPRGRLPTPGELPHALLRLLRRWSSAHPHDLRHDRLLGGRLLEPGPSRVPHERHPVLLRADRNPVGIREQPTLQGLQGTPMAAVHGHHRPPLSGRRLLHLFVLQRHPLFLPLLGVGALPGHHHRRRHVVLRVDPAGLPRRLRGVQARVDRVPHRHVDHRPRHPGAAAPSAPDGRDDGGRCGPLRRRLPGALLHHDLPVDGPVLLRLRIHPHRVPHPDHNLRRGHPAPGLQPALLGKPPLVVVLLLRAGIDRLVHLRVQRLLVQGIGGLGKHHDLPAVLRVHGADLLRHVADHGNRRRSVLPVVRQDHLRKHQGRLIITSSKPSGERTPPRWAVFASVTGRHRHAATRGRCDATGWMDGWKPSTLPNVERWRAASDGSIRRRSNDSVRSRRRRFGRAGGSSPDFSW
mmetsp:Transcript_15828/g.36645  ORF Transcript_15828/g.36645 Transcript_15828/m.36645 type:complete len:409 (+) Transcript_15828:1152-2378(+)